MVKSPKGQSGGARPGAGRPVASHNALGRVRAYEIGKSGKSPLDLMLDNMYFWHDHAKNVGQTLEVMLEEAKALPPEERNESLEKMKPLLQSFLAARENSQKCAVDAAPYVHPRLASIQFKKPGGDKKIITAELGTIAGDKEDRSYREGYGAVVPIKKAG